MGLWANSTLGDTLLARISSSAKKILVCNTQPASKILSTSTANLIGISTDLDFTGPGAGGSGRRLTVTITTDIAALNAANMVANHIVLISSSTMLFITQCTTRLISTSDTMTIPAWTIDVNDPTTG